MSAMRIIMPHLAAYIPEVEAILSQHLDADVSVTSLDTGWQGFGPAIRFEGVGIYQPETGLLLARANHFDVQLNLWASLLQRQLVPGRLTIDGLVLTLVRTENSSLKIQGFDDVIGEQSFNIFGLAKRFHRVDIKHSFFTVDLLQGDPIDLELMHFSLSPRRNNYRLEADLRQQATISKLTVIADLAGDISKPKHLTADGYIHLENIEHDPRYMQWNIGSIKPRRGTLTLDTWFKWHKGTWQEVIGEIQLKNAIFTNDEIDLSTNLTGEFAWQKLKHNEWLLSGDKISLQVNEAKASPIGTFVLHAGENIPWDFKLDAVSVADIVNIIELSDHVPDKLYEILEQLQPKGQFKNLQAVATPQKNKFTDWRVGVQVENWQQKAFGKLPAIKNISGELMLGKDYGQFLLNSENTKLNSGDIFSENIIINKSEGLVTWRNKDNVLHINAPEMKFKTQEFDLDLKLVADAPEELHKTNISLKVTAGDFSADTALRYFPGGVLPPKFVHWIYSSIGRGHVTNAEVLLEGPVMEFPFRENQGVFEFKISGTGIDLTYHKDWPMLHDVSAEAVVNTKNVQVYIDSGYFYHSEIEQAKILVNLTPITEPLYLTASGVGSGPATDVVDFLQRSPLWPKMQETFEQVSIEGQLDLDLDFKIPLRAVTPEQRVFNIDGVATLSNGEVMLNKWDLPFSEVNGSLQFSEKMLAASDVKGEILGRPARLNVTPVEFEDGYKMNWFLTSTFTSELLNEYLPTNLWSFVSGEADYSAQFNTYIPKRQQPMQVAIQSELKGIEVAMPAPIGKTKDEPVDVRFAATFAEDDATLARFEYGEVIHALLAMEKVNGIYQAERGDVVLGGGSPQRLAELQGLEISGHLETFRLDEWLIFLKQHSHAQQTTYPEWEKAEVLIDKLHYDNYTLHAATVSLQRLDQAWNFGIDSQELVGMITISDPAQNQPLVFDMQRCAWPALRGSTTDVNEPSQIIAFDFKCQNMAVGDRYLGFVHLRSNPQDNGVVFDPVIITNNVGSINAKGSWLSLENNTQTEFEGTAKTQDLSYTLENLGFSSDIRGAKGELNFDLSWPGSPLNIDKEKLSGVINAHLANGRIVEVNPGFGRVLGLLSVGSFQRRLRLDFSDVFKEGFSFDSFNGTATIAKGTIYTKDAKLKAPSANIDISGKAGLVDQELDFNLYLKAKVDPTIPAAAVAIANPIAGAAVWLAGKAVNPLGSMAYYHYHISGTWDDPVYIDLSEEYRKNLGGHVPVADVE